MKNLRGIIFLSFAILPLLGHAQRVVYDYDAAGNQTSLEDPDAGITTYEYDALGRIVRQTDARGKETAYTFDAVGKLTKRICGSIVTNYTYGTSGAEKERLIKEQTGKDDLCKRLMTIPYVGPICAFALANSMVDPANFDSARQFADYCGFAPYHTGTGGKVRVLGVARKGNKVLKRVLFEASSALVSRVKMDIDCAGKRRHSSDWIKGLTAGKPYKKATCAVANKICRIAWAIASVPGATYDQEKTSLVRVSDDSEDRKEAAANMAESGQVEPAPVLITTTL